MPEIPNSGEPTRHVRAVPPEVETLVPIQVPAESVCYLSHPSVSDHRLQLDADDQGMIRFHAKARSGAEHIELELRVIQGTGQETMHTVDFLATRFMDDRRAHILETHAPKRARCAHRLKVIPWRYQTKSLSRVATLHALTLRKRLAIMNDGSETSRSSFLWGVAESYIQMSRSHGRAPPTRARGEIYRRYSEVLRYRCRHPL